MKKEYEKPRLEVVKFEYDIQAAQQSNEGTQDVGGWWL